LNTNLALSSVVGRHLPTSNLNNINLTINKKIKISKCLGSAILRAIRSIRLNRDEWKLIRYIILMEKKIRNNYLFANSFYAKVGNYSNFCSYQSPNYAGHRQVGKANSVAVVGGVMTPKAHSDSFRLRSGIYSAPSFG
jgi:hypothetical protein